MRVVFRPPTQSDIDELALSMRPFDVLECDLVAGLAPREALMDAVERTDDALAMLIDGKVLSIFGCSEASFLGGEGHPWMLSATGIERHGRVVLTLAPRFFAEMQAGREHLSNIVHADNRSAIRFLRWCGFEFGETVTVKGEPFIRFSWTRAKAKAA